MPMRHVQKSDGSWKTYTDEEWNALNPPAGPLQKAFQAGATVGIIVALLLFYMVVGDLKRLNDLSAFTVYVFVPAVLSGLGGVFLMWRHLSGERQLQEKKHQEWMKKHQEWMEEREGVRKRSAEMKKEELEREIQELEEQRAEKELRQKAFDLQKEGREEEAARIFEELTARAKERHRLRTEEWEAERKKEADDKLAKMKAELEKLKGAK